MFTLHLIKQAQKEILKMPATLRESTFESLKQLELQGNQLKEPNVRDMGDGLKELRASSKEGISRSFFFFHIGKQIYVVHVLHKKTQKTPKQDLDLAKQRMKAIKEQLHAK
ncbi:type II toxin-antitoxin system RelE/ParE family toxin [Lonepinella sp. BR2919]|uniref:type II toxin-antitoxin system RelE/ParE family toxin n=1 Tax=unclassified Lonepinella TaxID=2642006 RepID=UPI003F6DFE75